MASLLKAATLFLAAAAVASTSASAAPLDTDAAVIYTTGGQGFHRHLLMHVPLVPSTPVVGGDDNANAFSITVGLHLRNTFFIDVAEADSQWDSRVLIGSSTEALAAQLATSPSRGGNGFVKSIALRHPIATKYPYDIEIPTVKTPYLFNEANVTFDVTVNAAAMKTFFATKNNNDNKVLAILSIPIHERYEDVTTDAAVTHVRRCVEASEVTIMVNKDAATVDAKKNNIFKSKAEALAIKFTQMEDTAAIVAASTDAYTTSSIFSNAFCVEVPVGFLGDLPFFYWSTMSMMVIGAVAVWAGLTFV